MTGARPRDPLRKQVLSESWATGLDADIDGPSRRLHRDEIRRDIESALSGQLTEAQKAQRQQLTLPNLVLKPGDEFFLLVDLHELRPGDRPDNITKDLELHGETRSGARSVPLVDALQRRRWFRRARFAGAAALFLADVVIVMVMTRVIQPFGGISCASGSAKLVGSTAFEPEIRTIANEYQSRCGAVSIDIQAAGTEEGIRELRHAPGANELASVADGQAAEPGELRFTPIAIVTSAVVVNSDVGIDSLPLDQLRGSYQGRYTNWRQLGAPVDLPIRLIS